MFLSGATKLLSGDPTWRHLTALDYHFETQPLPPWTAWYAHQLPAGIHRAGTTGMFVVELVAPWLIFAPPRLKALRYAGVGLLVVLQAAIALTGNYGFFNLLAIVLCVPALDDGLLRRVLPFGLTSDGRETLAWRARRCGVPGDPPAEHAQLLGRDRLHVAERRGMGLVPRWATAALGVAAPFRSVNGYGLFRVMTTQRPEIVVEGSIDGREWKPYEFRYKPGAVGRAPGFVAPLHPRLDWQMWFAALDPGNNLSLLQALSRELRAGSPTVLGLLERNPFPRAPPRFVRFALYDYRFTTPVERARTGAWWSRGLADVLARRGVGGGQDREGRDETTGCRPKPTSRWGTAWRLHTTCG